MIIKKNFPILSVIMLTLLTVGAYSMEKTQNHIVFDMGFLLQPNHTRFIKNLGLSGISHYLFSGIFNEQKALQELFGVIKDIELDIKEKDTETVFWQNQQVPQPMVSWLKNKVTCEKILEHAQSEIAKKYYFTSHMNSVVGMIFDPKACSQILSPNELTFKLINQLQKEGHIVHVLSNLHKDIRVNLVTTYPHLFSQINGKIIVSGDVEEVKCEEHSKLYEYLLDTIPNFHKIFFIETSAAYKKQIKSLAARQILKTIVADPTDSDLPVLFKELYKKGLLRESFNFNQNI